MINLIKQQNQKMLMLYLNDWANSEEPKEPRGFRLLMWLEKFWKTNKCIIIETWTEELLDLIWVFRYLYFGFTNWNKNYVLADFMRKSNDIYNAWFKT